jgi:hypothetical protein
MTYPTGDPRSNPSSPSPAAPQPSGDTPLQFDRAEYTTAPPPVAPGAPATAAQPQAAVTTCSGCQERLTGQYYAAGEHVVCPPCRDQILASMTGGSGARRFFRAVVFGCARRGRRGARLVRCAKISGYEIGLIAVVVGFAVGAAVRKGSDDRGGVAYQLLAVFLTYCCIVSSYVPEIYAEASKDSAEVPPAAILVFSVIIAFIAPVLMGLKNIIGLLIIAFALWEAWKINKKKTLEFAGPFMIAGAGGPAVPPPLQPAPPRWSDTPPPPPNVPPPPPPQLGVT